MTKEFVNNLLINDLCKLYYLKEIAPELRIDLYLDGKIILRDSKLRMLIYVFDQNGEFHCEKDKRTDCIHSKYVWSSPEVEFDELVSLMGIDASELAKIATKRKEYNTTVTR